MSDLADFIAIVTALLAIVFFIYPKSRNWLQFSLQKLFSPTCVALIFFGILFILSLFALPATFRKVESFLATVTPTPTSTPTRTPVPTPNYSYLFFDDFNNGTQPAWRPEYGEWGMVNDAYTLTNVVDGADWTKGLSFVGDSAWTNYQAGAVVHLENIEPRINIAYIIVRAQDTSNFLVLELRDYDFLDSDWSRGTWYVVQNGNWTERPSAGFPIPITTKFNVAIQVNQDIITTYVDG